MLKHLKCMNEHLSHFTAFIGISKCGSSNITVLRCLFSGLLFGATQSALATAAVESPAPSLPSCRSAKPGATPMRQQVGKRYTSSSRVALAFAACSTYSEGFNKTFNTSRIIVIITTGRKSARPRARRWMKSQVAV